MYTYVCLYVHTFEIYEDLIYPAWDVSQKSCIKMYFKTTPSGWSSVMRTEEIVTEETLQLYPAFRLVALATIAVSLTP